MGRIWISGLGACALVFGCGGGVQQNGPGAAGAGNGGSAGTSAGGSAGTTGPAGGAAGASSTATPIALADLCPVFTTDLCRYLMECTGARYEDAAQCQKEVDCYGLPQLIDADAKGVVDYDPSEVGACHERFSASPCTFGAFFGVPDIYGVLAFCPGAVTPKQVAGSPCSSNGECLLGLYCNKGTDSTCPGKCDTPEPNGADCSGSLQCADGLVCEPDVACLECDYAHCAPVQHAGDACIRSCSYALTCASDQICPDNIWCDNGLQQCQPGRMTGEPCGNLGTGLARSDANCAVHLWCDALPFGAGTCRVPAGEGAPCNTEPGACQKGLHCSNYSATTLGTCSSSPGASGAGCAVAADCQSGLACAASRCATPSASGGTCFSDDDCAPLLVCQNSKCQPALYPGAACSSQAPCTFGRCVAGTCQSHAKVGEDCALDSDCTTGHCVDSKCYDNSICRLPPATL